MTSLEQDAPAIELTDKQKQIQTLWNDGKTATEIGDMLGTSRSAILGTIKRCRAHGYKFIAKPTKLIPKPEPGPDSIISHIRLITGVKSIKKNNEIRDQHVEKNKKVSAAIKALPIRITPANEGAGLLITELVRSSCRAIINDSGDHVDWRYCGDVKKGEGAYCAAHRAMYYIKPVKRSGTRQNMVLPEIKRIF